MKCPGRSLIPRALRFASLVTPLLGCAGNSNRGDCFRIPLAPTIHVRPVVTTPGLTVLVLDASSNAPIVPTRVWLVGDSLSGAGDEFGVVRIPKAAGSIRVAIRGLGYSMLNDTLTIPGSGGRFLIVQLRRDPACLEEDRGLGPPSPPASLPPHGVR